MIIFNIILLSKYISHVGFSLQNLKVKYYMHFCHVCYTSRPSYPHLFGHPDNNWWRAQIMKFVMPIVLNLRILNHVNKVCSTYYNL